MFKRRTWHDVVNHCKDLIKKSRGKEKKFCEHIDKHGLEEISQLIMDEVIRQSRYGNESLYINFLKITEKYLEGEAKKFDIRCRFYRRFKLIEEVVADMRAQGVSVKDCPILGMFCYEVDLGESR